MTDKTNPNRWTAEVRQEHLDGWALRLMLDGNGHNPIRTLWFTDGATPESLADLINRPAPTAPVTHNGPPLGPTVSVDDGEVWLTREGDGWRLGVQVDERGNYVSHLLTAGEAAMLFVAVAPTAPADDDDDLYLCLHGAREASCLAQMQVDDRLSERIEKVIRHIDAIGTERLPQWSRYDRDHELDGDSTAPADDLPPGYIEWNGETWVMPGTAIVDGWGWWDTSNPCPGLRQVCGPRPTKVRRIIPAEPATEWVPWATAFVNELPMLGWNGQHIKNAQKQAEGVFLSTWGLFPVIRVELDGKVEVQR